MIKTARSFSLSSPFRAQSLRVEQRPTAFLSFSRASFFRLSLNARVTPKPEIWYFRSTLWSPARVQIWYSCTHDEESLESISDGNRSLVFSPALGGKFCIIYRTFDTKARCFFRLLSTLTTGLDDEDDEEVYT